MIYSNVFINFLDFTAYVFVLIIASGVICFILSYLLGRILVRPSPLDKRLQETYIRATTRKRVRTGAFISMVDVLKRNGNVQSKQKASLIIRGFFDAFFHKSFLKKDKIKILFDQAGWSTKNAHVLYYLGKEGSFFSCLSLLYVYCYFSESSLKFKFLFGLIVIFLAWNLFDWVLNRVIKKRVVRIEEGFPNALDLMLICVGAGLSFQKSIERVAREIYFYDKDVAKELALTSIELEIFLDNRQALINFSERVPSAIIRTFVTSLLQTMYQGTSIVVALDALSRETREKRVEMIEEKVARLPSLMVIPLVLFTLPNVFIILLGPSLVRVGQIF